MKTLILLVGIGLALASSSASKASKPKKEHEFVLPAEQYPELLVELDVVENEFEIPEKHVVEKPEDDFVIPEKQYPEVITEFEVVDYSQLPIEQLLQIASEHEGLEFLSDANATAAMGIDISTLSNDIVADAMATTVRYLRLWKM